MDSFFSLFDPSEGHSKQKNKIKQKPEQDTAKKKPEVTKGRRRGRKSAGKSETLPEESSFLCEPHLGTELLVKDVSYIENFIEVSKKVDESKQDDKKPKRRNSNRKTRRKKHKVSPCKDLVPTSGWNDDTTWNNRASVSRINLENVGKNVNDLKDSNKNVDGQESDSDGADVRNNRGDDSDSDGTEFKKNRDAAGRDFKYNRQDDSGSDVVRRNTDGQDTEESDFRKIGDGSSSDASFNNELRSAKRNVDVDSVISKLEKVLLKDDMYLAGDFDCNDLDKEEFYSSDDMEEYIDDSTSEPDDSGDEVYGSLPPEPRFGNVEYKLQLVSLCEKRFQHLVTQLKWRLRSGGGSCVYVIGVRDCGALVGLRARALRDSLRALRRMASALGAELAHVTARRVAPHRAVAEVTVRKLPDPKQSVELRVAVMGANEAGKSTLIGVLTQGELDNGRGSARLNMFRHLHEVKSGRTSSLSHEILGFDAQGNVVNYGCSELMTAERIGERSAKLVSFLDLAGHSKYQRTTLHGLTGYCPHYAMLVISATAGITPITEEHISLLSALDLPFFTVISKCELAPTALKTLVGRLGELFAPVNKKPLLITDENSARNCVAPQTLILDTLDGDKEHTDEQSEVVPVFPVSCVKGVGLSALHAYLLALRPPHGETPIQRLDDEEVEFQIDEVFHVGDSTGPVVGGLLVKGQLKEGDNVLIGPCESGAFLPCLVRSVHRNRVACFGASAGQSASVALGLGPDAPRPRPGLVLLSRPRGDKRPTHHEMTELIRTTERNLLDNSKNRKNVRRKNKNLLQDLAIAEVGLTKDTHSEERNIYHEEEKGEALEDPNDPRGCIYFQASVQLLRHASAMCPGFQCTVHVGNVRQTAVIEGIMSRNSELRAPEKASALFRFVRFPEYLVRGRRMLFTAGLGTRGIGRITQIFPHIP